MFNVWAAWSWAWQILWHAMAAFGSVVILAATVMGWLDPDPIARARDATWARQVRTVAAIVWLAAFLVAGIVQRGG